MKNKSKPVVLVAPLDWGIGHATRSFRLISELTNYGFEVILGISGKSGEYLLNCFPALNHINLPSFIVKYGKRSIYPAILFRLPLFVFYIYREYSALKKIITKHQIDIVISDNRYGLWNKNVFTVIITHQLFIKLPKYLIFVQRFIWTITRWMIMKFDECWIPDFPQKKESLSCELSHGKKMPENFRYIGLLSRFSEVKDTETIAIKDTYDLLAILSGPEPQRSIFENIIINQAGVLNIRTIILRGMPGVPAERKTLGNITIINHLHDEEFVNIVRQSDNIICRSGYSTIMDLVSLGKTAILVPTPGQTEQEYLAKYLALKDLFLCQSQKKLNLAEAIESLKKAKKSSITFNRINNNLLDNAIENLKTSKSGR